ncbi:MAG: hypothetical protein K8S98_01900 [Planctomycetes bacterium]|nr:hypothetical protein [Planctomycetota bacterium]
MKLVVWCWTILVSCCVVSFAPARQSMAELEKKLASADAKERQEAVHALSEIGGDAWTPIFKKGLRDPDARVADEAQLCVGRLANSKSAPLLFGKEGLASGDEWVRIRVAEALGRIPIPLAAKSIVGQLDERSAEVRRMLVWSIERRVRAGRISLDEVSAYYEALDRRVEKEKDPEVRAAAAVAELCIYDSLARSTKSGEVAQLGTTLRDSVIDGLSRDRAWQVRAAVGVFALGGSPGDLLAAMERLAADEHPGLRARAIETVAGLAPNPDGTIAGAKLLVDRLEHEPELRVRLDAYDALVRLSGFKYSPDPKNWRNWLREPRPFAEKSSDAPLGEYESFDMTTFAGLAVRSRRVAFLVDLSGSMWEPREDGKTRKQAVDVELGAALAKLGPETRFNVIPYTLEPIPWKKTLAPATPQNVREALEFFKGCTQHGKGDFWSAWLAALADPDVDSIVVLTDGAPTGGHRWNLELMRALLAEKNRFRRVALDAILVGASDFLVTSWTAMCADNRGSVVRSNL